MTFLNLTLRLFALFSIALLGLGVYLLWSWREIALASGGEGWGGGPDWRLATGVALLAWSCLGAFPLRMILGRSQAEGSRLRRQGGQRLPAPDGSQLYIETDGPPDAPVLVFVHGWGMDSTLWVDARRRLADRFQLVVWDLPGLGRSKRPSDGRFSLDRFAIALDEVVQLAGRRQILLVGHSIGGMIIQTYCRIHPERLRSQVAGLVLENTTHTNPLRTTFMSSLLLPMQPILEFLMRLDVWLSALVWLMNWQSYLSGSTHLALRLTGFGTRPTRGQLEQAALLATRNSPAVQAKGNLAMMRWDATGDLPRLAAPALVFTGGRDMVTRPEAGETIARLAPQTRLIRAPEAGHMGPVECADLYNGAIAAFADEVFARGARPADRADPYGRSSATSKGSPADPADLAGDAPLI